MTGLYTLAQVDAATFIQDNLFAFLYIGLAIYFIISAVRARGSMFDTSKIKEECLDDFKRTTRTILLATAALLLTGGLLELLTDWNESGSGLAWINTGIAVLAVVLLILMVPLTRKYQDPEKAFKPAPPRSRDGERTGRAEASGESADEGTEPAAEGDVPAAESAADDSQEYPRTPEDVDDGTAARKFY